MISNKRPKVLHIIDRLQVGGMENGLVNIINTTAHAIDHQILCLRSLDEQFKSRIETSNATVEVLGKREGNDLLSYPNLMRAVRKSRPNVVHTRNLPTVDYAPLVRIAGTWSLIHGEHGRDVLEPNGQNLKYNRLRKLVSPFVNQYVCVSKDLQRWLVDDVNISASKVTQIYNGVDTLKFSPQVVDRERHFPWIKSDDLLIGTVGRLEHIKSQNTLVDAFIALKGLNTPISRRAKLALVGDGSLRHGLQEKLIAAGLQSESRLIGHSESVSDLMGCLDVFVLPSINEGVSNTTLEAMACGIPVIATAVGGNNELVVNGETGFLIPPQDTSSLVTRLTQLLEHSELMIRMGQKGRQRVESEFSLEVMVEHYMAVYSAYF